VAFIAAEASCPHDECPAQSEALIQHHVTQQKVQTTGYEIGGDNTQSCGPDRVRLESPEECEEAAGALGKTFGYTGSYAGWPRYCFMYRDLFYFNNNAVSSSSRDDARLICERIEATTTTTTTSIDHPNVVSYELGLPGAMDCAVGHVVSTHIECASSAVTLALGISFSNAIQTHEVPSGCIYNSRTHARFFNSFQGGNVDADYYPVCKTETNPVIINFNQGEYDTNVCGSGQPIEDEELCREAAAHFGEVFSTSGSYSGYPQGCFKFLNGDVYFNRHEGNHPSPNAAPICVG
ncbi:unnamed protein product, partial [Symbiodinium natans]